MRSRSPVRLHSDVGQGPAAARSIWEGEDPARHGFPRGDGARAGAVIELGNICTIVNRTMALSLGERGFCGATPEPSYYQSILHTSPIRATVRVCKTSSGK